MTTGDGPPAPAPLRAGGACVRPTRARRAQAAALAAAEAAAAAAGGGPEHGVRWVAEVVRTAHGSGNTTECFVRPEDCPQRTVYYTEETVYIPVPY